MNKAIPFNLMTLRKCEQGVERRWHEVEGKLRWLLKASR
jgi:hypothetical protein